MAQIRVSLDTMRSYVRGLDERLIDQTKYPDSWVDSKINTAYEVISTRRQPFVTEEVLDLSDYITDGTELFTFDMQYDVVGYKRIFATLGEQLDYMQPLTYTTNQIYQTAVTWEIYDDQTVAITLDVDNLDATDTNIMTFQYWYIPTVPEVETYMSADVYHMLRHGMEFAVYESLRDLEKFAWAESKLEASAKSVTNGLDIDIRSRDQWNGGFSV